MGEPKGDAMKWNKAALNVLLGAGWKPQMRASVYRLETQFLALAAHIDSGTLLLSCRMVRGTQLPGVPDECFGAYQFPVLGGRVAIFFPKSRLENGGPVLEHPFSVFSFGPIDNSDFDRLLGQISDELSAPYRADLFAVAANVTAAE